MSRREPTTFLPAVRMQTWGARTADAEAGTAVDEAEGYAAVDEAETGVQRAARRDAALAAQAAQARAHLASSTLARQMDMYG